MTSANLHLVLEARALVEPAKDDSKPGPKRPDLNTEIQGIAVWGWVLIGLSVGILLGFILVWMWGACCPSWSSSSSNRNKSSTAAANNTLLGGPITTQPMQTGPIPGYF